MAKLSGGVAIIKVGAGTEVELKEKKHRVEDALSATRSAVEEGIVPGGGVALINAQSSLDSLKLEGDAADRRQHRAPRARGAASKSSPRTPACDGRSCSRTCVARQAEEKSQTVGYDVIEDEYVDMLERGIVDPAKVTRSAVENAASIGGMVLTTEVMITDKPEPKSAMPQMPPGGGMGDLSPSLLARNGSRRPKPAAFALPCCGVRKAGGFGYSLVRPSYAPGGSALGEGSAGRPGHTLYATQTILSTRMRLSYTPQKRLWAAGEETALNVLPSSV